MDQDTTQRLPPISDPSSIERTLEGRYAVFEEVGYGAMARVCRAWDLRLNHVVAVKILDSRFAGDEEVIEAFELGAKKAASLPPHRHIVSVHDAGTDEGLPYLVMESVTGTNLKDRISAQAPIAVDQAFDICRQTASALEFAHQYGLVHGNIRPQNVLLTREDRVKVTDFGVGRAAETLEGIRASPILVRSQYMAPEQALGKQPTVASDVYSLGVVLFEMLTGRLPFDGDDPWALARQHAHHAPPELHQLNPRVTPAVSTLVLRALEKDPQKRYRSAAAFALALRQHILLQAGSTAPHESNGHAKNDPTVTASSPLVGKVTSHQLLTPVQRPRRAGMKTRRLSLTSVVFLVTALLACAGGYYAYNGTAGALKGWSGFGRPTPGPPPTAAPRRTSGQSQHRKVVPGATHLASGCTARRPVRFLRFWADEIRPLAGSTITFRYTIANNAPHCRDIALGLTAFNSVNPGRTFRDVAHRRVVRVMPGVHVYQRQFTFPPAAAGQQLDVLLTVADPSGRRVDGVIRVNRLIAVRP